MKVISEWELIAFFKENDQINIGSVIKYGAINECQCFILGGMGEEGKNPTITWHCF